MCAHASFSLSGLSWPLSGWSGLSVLATHAQRTYVRGYMSCLVFAWPVCWGGGDIFPPICAFVCCSVCLKACVYICVTAPVSVSVSVFFLAYEIARACVCVCMDVYTHCVHLGVCVWPLPTPTQCITKFCPLWPCRNLWNLVLLPSPLTTHLDDCNKSLCVSDFASFNLFFT